MASRSLDDLHPLAKALAIKFLAQCKAQGVNVLIYCTWRSAIEQNHLYAMGRTEKSNVGVTLMRPLGKIVTNAKAGQSAHNFTLNGKPAAKAWDCCPTDGDNLIWNPSHPDWKIMGDVAEELGLNWYGKPGSKFFELVHFQIVC